MKGVAEMAIGKPTPVVDARTKVAGNTQYTADLHRPGMLYGKLSLIHISEPTRPY